MLTVVTPEQAVEIINENVKAKYKTAEVSLENAVGRILSEDVKSPENLPAFSRSTVDGFAVRAEDTYGCSEALPAMLRFGGKILMGEDEKRILEADGCLEIPTGGRMPQNATAAVMVENTEDSGDEFRLVLKPCAPFENVVRLGEDCKEGETVLSAGTVIEPRHTAVLAALGISRVRVTAQIKAGVISTGDELVEYCENPTGTQIRNINSVMLSSSLETLGCETVCYPIVPDEEKDLDEILKKAISECDIVLISGGSSVGERDNVSRVVSKFADIKFHGVALKPGKPTMFAVRNEKIIFGLPGHPAASFFTFQKFVQPAVLKMNGKKHVLNKVKCKLSENISSNHGRAEIIAVKIEEDECIPLRAKSGMVSFLAKADGYIYIPRDTEGMIKGGFAEVTLF